MMAPLHYYPRGLTGPWQGPRPSQWLKYDPSKHHLNVQETLERRFTMFTVTHVYTHWRRWSIFENVVFISLLRVHHRHPDLILVLIAILVSRSPWPAVTTISRVITRQPGTSRPSLADNCGIKRGYLQWPGAAPNGLLAPFVFSSWSK